MAEDDPTPTRRLGARVPAGRRVGGRYDILREIGRGGMGSVHAARDTVLDRDVALKLIALDEAAAGGDTRERFLREARASARLRHPNVVAIHDAGTDPLGLFLVFELVEGESLERLLVREGALPPQQAARIVAQVASGLAAAHALGIVHRDIKPSNILIGADGAARLADFGIARLEGATRLTDDNVAVGTPGFMAPEQISGSRAGPPADIFALGCVLFTLLAGHGPFDAGSAQQVIARILAGRPDDLPVEVRRAAPRLASLVQRMLRHDPARRPASAQEVAEALRLDEVPAVASRRRHAVAASLATLGVLGVGALAWSVRHDRAGSPADATGPGASVVDAAAAPVTQAVTLVRASAAELLQRAPRVRGVEARATGPSEITLSGPAQAVHNERELMSVIDALTGHDFARDGNLFTTGRPSSWTMSVDAREMGMADLVQAVSMGTQWPTVQDPALNGLVVTVKVTDAPWDASLQALLDGMERCTLRHGGIWIVAAARRCDEIRAQRPPAVVVQRPRKARPAALVAALRAAGSERCVAKHDKRLGAIVIVDRADRLDGLARAWAAMDAAGGAAPDFSERIWDGEPVSLSVRDADFDELLGLIAELGHVNLLRDPATAPDRRPPITFHVNDVPWDNVLETILLARGLAFERESNVVRIFRADAADGELVSSVVQLKNMPAEFFESFTPWLTPAGTLAVDAPSGTLVVRDTRARAAWFRRFAESIDARAGGAKR